jgi:hypothetical protein
VARSGTDAVAHERCAGVGTTLALLRDVGNLADNHDEERIMHDHETTDSERSDREPVNPADRDTTEAVEPSAASTKPSRQSSQSEQNQDQNTEYDPSHGKRPDQRRRNDKRGQMGG